MMLWQRGGEEDPTTVMRAHGQLKKRLCRFVLRDQLYGTNYLESRYYTYITRVFWVANRVANTTIVSRF